MDELLRRKVDGYLAEWKNNHDRKPLIVKGARQIGKTRSIERFAERNYKSVVQINFVEQKKYKDIFDDGFEVNTILKNISLLNPELQFLPGDTLFFFDELQACPNCATALKFFKLDGRFDVICSGSPVGINYKEIESNSVGYKEEYEMSSMDFEEFLWAKGYTDDFVEDLYQHMLEVKPLANLKIDVLFDIFRDYVTIGGMPEVVNTYIKNKNFSGTLNMQRQLLKDYEEDITKYAEGLDKAKVKAVYNHISRFLAKENKRFQVTKIGKNARNRDYVGCVEWLADAGVINVCYCMNQPELPLKGNYDPKLYKIYFKDTGLLIASLDEEAQEDLRANKNLGTYKGAIYENIVGDMLAKQGYKLYYYNSDKPALEMDFFVRDADTLIPVEVKANDGATASLNNLLREDKYPDIRYGIKLGYKNIGSNGKYYTFPYFLTFLLKRFVAEKKREG
ncbi:MAG: ATP-binding protein [Prevotella sp.]|uniref:ATP-binding protein n=1 Tax=Prevotella sp. TaxID=59823 RepID=UPI002A2C1FF3|nr:ATP-binding protein [Prevotella sp.]MDD7317829.1 ATP-binding protein [Prevotellaceae bacterium]MDY4020744.1 ATP-binding protein [Prevotella sp.]